MLCTLKLQVSKTRRVTHMDKIELELIPPYFRSGKLLDDFCVVTKSGKICAPKGFKTDFASVPRIFWRIFPPWGVYSPAAVIHDYLYRYGSVSRKAADDIFLEIMTTLKVPYWKRYSMYWAVRSCGAPSYKGFKGVLS